MFMHYGERKCSIGTYTSDNSALNRSDTSQFEEKIESEYTLQAVVPRIGTNTNQID